MSAREGMRTEGESVRGSKVTIAAGSSVHPVFARLKGEPTRPAGKTRGLRLLTGAVPRAVGGAGSASVLPGAAARRASVVVSSARQRGAVDSSLSVDTGLSPAALKEYLANRTFTAALRHVTGKGVSSPLSPTYRPSGADVTDTGPCRPRSASPRLYHDRVTSPVSPTTLPKATFRRGSNKK